jgi:hypothetical protein
MSGGARSSSGLQRRFGDVETGRAIGLVPPPKSENVMDRVMKQSA